MERYAGHPLNKGKLTMGLHYGIKQKQLKAENKFLIDHFTLGPRNDSTNATHLPVKLAVALLKDRKGQINLDIPLSGKTDDPQFAIAPLIFKVILNVIVKAATSPFSLLGALVGGGEELSFVEFEAARAELLAPHRHAPGYQYLRIGFHARIGGGTRRPDSRRQPFRPERPEEPGGVRSQRRNRAYEGGGQKLNHRKSDLPDKPASSPLRRRSPHPRANRSEAAFRHPGLRERATGLGQTKGSVRAVPHPQKRPSGARTPVH